MGDSPLPPPPTSTSVRTLAGRYRLERCLAVGGMAEVWVATDLVLDRSVAVKLLKPALAADPRLVERFRREAVAAARLSHASIVAVFDTVHDADAEAVVMELVPGRTLRQLLDDEGRLPVTTTVHIGVALADALTAAHRAGIVHRDVKPGNVLMSSEGRILLTDFGIAKALQETDDLTSDDVMMGTAKYLSPEQVMGLPLDGRSDLYALGIVLYECLTGQVPFQGPSDGSVAMARLQRDAVPVRSIRPGVPRPLDDLISRLLARQADARPRNAALVRDALVRLDGSRADDATVVVARDPTPSFGTAPVTSHPFSPVDPTPPGGRIVETSRPWVVSVVVLCLLAAALGISGAVFFQTSAGSRIFSSAKAALTGGDATPRTTIPATTVPSSQPVGIVSQSEFDPAGDGRENPGMVKYLIDHDLATVWSTVCYNDRDLAPKPGVGLILELSGAARGHTLVVDSPTEGGWGAQVYVARSRGEALADWGRPVVARTDLAPGQTVFPLGDGDGRYVLLFINQLGHSVPPCSRRWEAQISEVAIG